MKVTVVTAVLNGIGTIDKCLRSVQSQQYGNIEHLIIDGGSTDGTVEYLSSSGLIYITEPDSGVYDALNKGIIRASGDVIHILNADDYYADTDIVTNAVTLLEEHNLDLCHGFVEQVDNAGNVIWKIGGDVGRPALLRKMKVAHPSVFVRKAVYDKYGGYSVGFKIAADQDFLLRVWDKIKIGFIGKTFVKMGMGGISNSNIELSYRESAAVSLLHGGNLLFIPLNYVWQVFKHKIIVNFVRKLGYRKK